MYSTIYTIIKDLYHLIQVRVKVKWEIGARDHKLVIINTSKVTAHRVKITYDEGLLWSLTYTPQAIEGGCSVQAKYTRLSSSLNTGYVHLNWTNKRGTKKYHYKHQINF